MKRPSLASTARVWCNRCVTRILGTITVAGLDSSATLRGAASAFNLRGNTVNEYRHYTDAVDTDMAAIAGDWQQVGADLESAYRKVVADSAK